MAPLSPASPDDLPQLGELVADDPFWHYASASTAGQGVAHLRVWLAAGHEPGHLAVVTQTGPAASVTESAGRIWAALTRRYGPSLVLLEHRQATEAGEGVETLDLVRIGADGSPHWTRIWPTPEENPRHAGLELWMATYGHQIVSRPASAFDWCQDEDGLPPRAGLPDPLPASLHSVTITSLNPDAASFPSHYGSVVPVHHKGDHMRYVGLVVLALALAACGSSPPSPTQKWHAGPGGKCLAKVEQDLAATGGNFTSEAYAVWTDSLKCLNNPPPVGGALYSNVMGAIGAAAMFGGGASGGQMGDQTGTALADASKSLSHAVTLLRDAPPADTWAPGLAKALGG